MTDTKNDFTIGENVEDASLVGHFELAGSAPLLTATLPSFFRDMYRQRISM